MTTTLAGFIFEEPSEVWGIFFDDAPETVMERCRTTADLAEEIARAVFRFEDDCGERLNARERGDVIIALRRATIG